MHYPFFAGQDSDLTGSGDTLVFLILGFVLATVLTSFMDAGVAVAAGRNEDYWSMWTRRLFTNMLSVLTIVPPLVIIAARWDKQGRGITGLELFGIDLYLSGDSATSIYAFDKGQAPAMTYAPLPLGAQMWKPRLGSAIAALFVSASCQV